MIPDEWFAWGANDPEGIPVALLAILATFAMAGLVAWLLRGREIAEVIAGVDGEPSAWERGVGLELGAEDC